MDNAETSATAEVLDTDILMLGAGPVGMTLALALANGNQNGLRVHLLDRRPRGAWSDDPRGLALSHGCRQLLERLNAWNATAGTPIKEIHVSQRGGFGRTMIDASDYKTPALGYVMRYRDLAAALDARIPTAQWLQPGRVDLDSHQRQRCTGHGHERRDHPADHGQTRRSRRRHTAERP